MGSVKDLTRIRNPTSTGMGIGYFDFSNRYSIFDYGEMPDHIPNKGAALCMMSAYFFGRLKEIGIRTHYGKPSHSSNDDGTDPFDRMHINLVNVIKPTPNGDGTFDYSEYENPSVNNLLVPLEVIFRYALPEGSSVPKRIDEGSLQLEDLRLTRYPLPGDMLQFPYFEASTKLEPSDRFVDWTEASEISGLTPNRIQNIKDTTLLASGLIFGDIIRTGLRLDDGKFEFAITPDGLMIVDTVGTLDECRFTYFLGDEQIQISKEIPRQWYKKREPTWVEEIEKSKKEHPGENVREYVPEPDLMPPEFVDIISDLYGASTNAVLGRSAFNAPPLNVAVREYKRFRDLEMLR